MSRTFTRVGKTPGIFKRGNTFYAGYRVEGRWTMKALAAENVTEAKKARDSLVAGVREGRIAVKNDVTFAAVFEAWLESRSISARTEAHERHLCGRHLTALTERRVQDITRRELARILKGMKENYSPWTATAVHRLMVGVFALAVRDDIITRSPADRLSPAERPRQKNAKDIERLDSATMSKLIAAASTERWKAALALAGLGGLRIGEVRALRWEDIDFDANALYVRRSLLPSGEAKRTKSEAGRRTIALFPELRRLLLTWRIKSPRTDLDDYVVCTHDGGHVAERNLRRALDIAKTKAKLDGGEKRLSWHSLRHSAGSIWLTEYGLPVTTVSAMMGHSNPAFTLACYGRDPRDEQAVVTDVLARAAAAT